MTRDNIIKMAREAGFRAGHIDLHNSDPLPFVAPCSATDCLPELERFAALVAAAEREACAVICDEMHEQWKWGSDDPHSGPADCAAAIRERGESDAY